MSSTESGHDVPAYHVDEFGPKRHRYCLLVFVINEGEKIRNQVEKMAALTEHIDIAIADGGSTDGSLEPDHLTANGVRGLLTKSGAGKLSAQMRMAFDWALREGYEGVVVVDGNGKDGLEAVPDFVRLLNEGYDHVQGSRFIPGGRAINTPRLRWVAVRLVHAPLVSIAAHRRHTDTTNGFRAYSARLLADPGVSVFRDVFDSYELHYHLAIESSRSQAFRVIETPVTRAYPEHGKVPTKISPIRGNFAVLRTLLLAVSGRFRTKKVDR